MISRKIAIKLGIYALFIFLGILMRYSTDDTIDKVIELDVSAKQPQIDLNNMSENPWGDASKGEITLF
ncbi:hypothetical protein [Photobacterium kishitanii]|uniref:hypothetical protein n=1 Tax=Photobacterium kishitanii TaxID=318456 RepID=UPI0007F88D77|nr:hypothetical protein [Photobacterium kishitanii]OBU31357.1 hypothetical protein AYY23_19695 [Photobacterium kishitanii]PSW49969.1 hypothetical protein C0W66_06690 [Photobacterium kishitanii]